MITIEDMKVNNNVFKSSSLGNIHPRKPKGINIIILPPTIIIISFHETDPFIKFIVENIGSMVSKLYSY